MIYDGAFCTFKFCDAKHGRHVHNWVMSQGPMFFNVFIKIQKQRKWK